MEVSNWPGPLTVPSLLSRKNPCWVTRFAHPPTHMHASRRTQARTHSCTHACWTFTTWRAPTHAFTHREIYICMATHTHALFLSEQILASLCGLIVCQVSILHLCITRCCTQSRKAKKNNSPGICPIPSWIRCMLHRKCNQTLADRVILLTDVQIFVTVSFQVHKQTSWVS